MTNTQRKSRYIGSKIKNLLYIGIYDLAQWVGFEPLTNIEISSKNLHVSIIVSKSDSKYLSIFSSAASRSAVKVC